MSVSQGCQSLMCNNKFVRCLNIIKATKLLPMIHFVYLTLTKALAKLANIASKTLLFVSVSSAMDSQRTFPLGREQRCLTGNVDQFRQALSKGLKSYFYIFMHNFVDISAMWLIKISSFAEKQYKHFENKKC